MPSWVARLAPDEYLLWSTVVDAPITPVVDRSTAVGMWGADRVARADEHVVSCEDPHYWKPNAEALVAFNRAGPDEECLTLDQIRHQYSPAAVAAAYEEAPDA